MTMLDILRYRTYDNHNHPPCPFCGAKPFNSAGCTNDLCHEWLIASLADKPHLVMLIVADEMRRPDVGRRGALECDCVDRRPSIPQS